MSDIIILVASDQKNVELGHAFCQELEKQGLSHALIQISTLNLPLYTQAEEQKLLPPNIVQKIPLFLKAKGYIFIAPEYNGGVPPSLVNFLAWVSRASEDWRHCFNEKAAIIATHSGSGGNLVLSAMRTQLAYIGMNVLGRQIHTHFKKQLNPGSLVNVVSQLKKAI